MPRRAQDIRPVTQGRDGEIAGRDERCENDIDVCASPASCAAKCPQTLSLPSRLTNASGAPQMPFSISIAEVRQHLANIHGDHIELHQRLAGESDATPSERLHPPLPRLSASLNSNHSAESLFASSFCSDEGTANDGGLHSTGLQSPWLRRHFRLNATIAMLGRGCGRGPVERREAEKRKAFGRLSAAIEDVAGLINEAQYLELFDAAKVVFDAWGRDGPGLARTVDDVLAGDVLPGDVLAYE